jgi:enoyl-CoA hydratase/carnithine racemase
LFEETILDTGTEKLLASVEGPVGRIVFNQPAKRNAMSYDMWLALPKALDLLEAEEQVRVIVLEGAGTDAFVSGADISEFDKIRNADTSKDYNALASEAFQRLGNTAKPTVASIRGFCFGAGVGLASYCDLRIADHTAKFAIPAAKLGLAYPLDNLERLLHLVGASNAREIFFTARTYDAADALRIGLVNRVAEPGGFEAAVEDCVGRIAVNAPLTIAAAKISIGELLKANPDLARCRAASDRAFASADYAEGRRAFMEKRKPVFSGR